MYGGQEGVLGATAGDGEWQAECIEEEELLG
jgi:hypothetical protein